MFTQSITFYISGINSTDVWKLWNRFSGKRKPFSKNWSTFFESVKIGNASYLYKTVISEASVETNRMVGTKWIYHKEWSFASNYFFRKFYFSLRTFYKELIWCINDPNAYMRTFSKRWFFTWRCFFLVSILQYPLE